MCASIYIYIYIYDVLYNFSFFFGKVLVDDYYKREKEKKMKREILIMNRDEKLLDSSEGLHV